MSDMEIYDKLAKIEGDLGVLIMNDLDDSMGDLFSSADEEEPIEGHMKSIKDIAIKIKKAANDIISVCENERLQ